LSLHDALPICGCVYCHRCSADRAGPGEAVRRAGIRRRFIGSHTKPKNMTPAHRELLREFQDVAQTAPSTQSFMELIAKRLHEKVTRYNWTGFYLIDPAHPGYLVVGSYAGRFTPNSRIPLATGLCGAAGTSAQVHAV